MAAVPSTLEMGGQFNGRISGKHVNVLIIVFQCCSGANNGGFFPVLQWENSARTVVVPGELLGHTEVI